MGRYSPSAVGVYPTGKPLAITDLPRAIDPEQISESTKTYLSTHGLLVDDIVNQESCYFFQGADGRTQGICYLLEGEPFAYQVRFTGSHGAGPRYAFPPGLNLSRLMYCPRPVGKNVNSTTLFIVEGSTDAVAIASCGFSAVSVLSANVPDARILTAKERSGSYSRVICIPDNDSPGQKVITKFSRCGFHPLVRQLPPWCKDICDLAAAERNWFLQCC